MSSRHQDWDPRCKVYVGNLGSNAARGEIEEAFSKYGTLRNVWVARNPPGFAFVEFEDPRYCSTKSAVFIRTEFVLIFNHVETLK